MIAGESEEAGPRRSGVPEPFDLDSATLRVVYQETCKSHGAIVDFRAKLLALLPLASGVGVFVLLGKVNDGNQTFLVPIGLFGIAVTFGLLMYELRGIEDCTMLRERAKMMEKHLGVPADESQFGNWGPGKRGLVDEIGAGWIVYTAVMFSWAGLTIYGFWGKWPWNWYWVSLLVVGAIVLFLTVLVAALGQRGRKWVVYRSDAGQFGAAHAREWEHTALAVDDLDRAIAFYGGAFGYEVDREERRMTHRMQKLIGLRSVECDLAQLHSPISGHVLELIAFRNIPAGSEEHGPTRAGFGHLSFVVDDLDFAVAAVEGLGGYRLGEVTQFDGDRRVYCRDPAGTIVELAEHCERE